MKKIYIIIFLSIIAGIGLLLYNYSVEKHKQNTVKKEEEQIKIKEFNLINKEKDKKKWFLKGKIVSLEKGIYNIEKLKFYFYTAKEDTQVFIKADKGILNNENILKLEGNIYAENFKDNFSVKTDKLEIDTLKKIININNKSKIKINKWKIFSNKSIIYIDKGRYKFYETVKFYN